jgi:hypothetical protein
VRIRVLGPCDRARVGSQSETGSALLADLAAAMVGGVGRGHALPAAGVVAGYADTSRDNRFVLAQEWLAESLTMWFASALVIGVTAIDCINGDRDGGSPVTPQQRFLSGTRAPPSRSRSSANTRGGYR